MAVRDPRVTLEQILEAAANAERFTAGLTLADLHDNVEKVYALTTAFAIIGEAANRLPLAFCERYRQIPWRTMIDMRHRVVHGYDDVDLAVVWSTVRDDLPPLRAELAAILAQLDQEDPA